MILKVIPTALIPTYWEDLCPFIEAALEESKTTEYTVEEARLFLEGGAWDAVGFFEMDGSLHGVVTIAVQNYPNCRVAFVTAFGGKGLTNNENWQQLRDICKAAGCAKLQAFSRDSVARLLRSIGFSNRAVLVEQDL